MPGTFEERVELLNKIGIGFAVQKKWVEDPETGKREPRELPLFTKVVLPLTPVQWCYLCMSDEDGYVGGCCGTMSSIQDKLNYVFRFGGEISVEDLADMALSIVDHGDFEGVRIPFGKLDKPIEEIAAAICDASSDGWDWETCDPWDIIALCWHLTKDHYAPPIPRSRDTEGVVEDAINQLSNGTTALSWRLMCGKPGRHLPVPPPDDDGYDVESQSKSNYSVLLARLIPPLKILHERIKELDPGPMDGYALVDKKNGEIRKNYMGMCILPTQEDAAKLITLWKQQEEEAPEGDRRDIDALIGIRPVRVTLEEGCVFTGDLL